MSLPNVTMQPAAGMTTPSIVYLPDGTSVMPNASGQISIASKYVGVMVAAGWQVIVSSGTTHVP
jgi:hypothetical protein